MAVIDRAIAARPLSWRLVLVLVVAAGAVFWFLGHEALPFASFDAATYTDSFWPKRFELVPHIVGGTVAILVGLVQIWLGLTGRTGALHRMLGRIYMGAVAVYASRRSTSPSPSGRDSSRTRRASSAWLLPG